MNDFLFGCIISTTPILIAACGDMLVQRSGVLNIGIEGIMLSGALAAYLVTVESGSPMAGLAAALVAGLAAALLIGIFMLWLGCDQIVAGTALNLFAFGLTGLVYQTYQARHDQASPGSRRRPRRRAAIGLGFPPLVHDRSLWQW